MTATALPPRLSSFSSQMSLGVGATPSKDGSQTQTIQTLFFSYTISGSKATALYGLYGVVAVVTFDGDGATLSRQSKSVLYGKEHGNLPGLEERAGYTAGWYTDEGTPVTSSAIVQTTVDRTTKVH